MRVPLSWLKDFVEITIPLDDLIHRMIMAGLEVANVEHIGDTWQRDKLFVGESLRSSPIPMLSASSWPSSSMGRGRHRPWSLAHPICAGRARPESGFCG